MAETIPADPRLSQPAPLPIRDPDWVGTPLPAPLTSFVGRERELAAVTDLLRQPEVRLVTLTGPGGVGKTRLALRVTSELIADFPNGAAFVSLAAISDPVLVPSTIAQAIESSDPADRAPAQRVAGVLRSKRVLLVVDNFEQVIEAASFLAELLVGCPGLTMLVTSRSSLHISGEHEFPVEPLPVPDPASLPAIAELAGFGAVKLFIQRARAVRPDFAIQEGNAPAVAEICARLDGLPLAIELAAARSKVLSPQAVLARLEHRLSLLTGGSRDYPERLRAMREAIAWSYDLLAPHEQALFQRLGVFAGGCTVAAVEAVVARGEASAPAILDSLTALVDSSLLVQRQQADGEPRFTMLETIREYALELLAAAGTEAETRDRLATWCLALAEQFNEFNERWMDPAVAVSRLAPEHDNLRASLAWLESTGDRAGAVRLAGAIFGFWYVHGDLREGLSWLERTPPDAEEIPAAVRARALLGAGMLAHYAADDARAIPWLETSLALYRSVDHGWGIGFTHLILGIAAEDSGDFATAANHFAESIVPARAIGNEVMTGLVLLHQAIIAWGQGDPELAERLAGEALAVQRPQGEFLYGAAESIGFLGLLACEAGDLPRSVALQRESLSVHLQLGYLEIIAANLANVAMLALTTKRPVVAARLFGAAYAQRETIGNPFKVPERAVYDRAVDATKALLAGDAFATAWAAGRAQSLAEAVAEAFAALDEIGGQIAAGAPAAVVSVAGLTAREVEVLRLLVAGGSNREIADALFVSPRTVQVHLANVFSKLDVHSRAAAVARAYELGLN